MNAGIVISTIIGGLLLLSVFILGTRVTQSADQTAMNNMAKTEVESISQYVGFDFDKIGYKATVFPILKAKKHMFTFLGDVNGDGICDTVTWKYGPDNTGQSNYAHGNHPIFHIVDGVSTKIDRDVVSLEIVYILSDGTETNNPKTKEVDQIKKIRVTMTCQLPAATGEEPQIATWQRTIVPANLQL
ncbi:MAG TPA: hypothetical protein VKA08_15030 [Balneolales bacterium]|nr:hypothetical protein [Balneolales bacterium]